MACRLVTPRGYGLTTEGDYAKAEMFECAECSDKENKVFHNIAVIDGTPTLSHEDWMRRGAIQTF